jgi:tetratricopeptide (TPR) repeat protein
LLLLGLLQTEAHAQAWAVAFYLLAVVFNYPHFMATVYRAYRTREEFSRYKIYTIHLTLLLALTAILAHASFRLLPWVFTLYICWSPWHYTGQNFGLLMMFVRRCGAEISAVERHMIHLAFIASYVMLLISFHTDASSDPYILSLNIPHRISVPGREILGAIFAVLALLAFARLAKRNGLRALMAPMTLLVTQALWFAVPTILELGYGLSIPQTRYSSGILAVLHSTQYLWITSYYQQREARAAGDSAWRMSTYFATLIAGGIALFIPAPWLVSYAFHYDFTSSFLIFTALVNIHHFILDGAIWKLRDRRVAALLVDGDTRTAAAGAAAARNVTAALGGATRWLAGRSPSAHAVRMVLATVLFLWGGADQFHFFLGADENNLPHLERAAAMNPYDATMQLRIARAESRLGAHEKADEALLRAIATNPRNPGPQHARARALLLDGRYDEAYKHYTEMLKVLPRDPDALVSFGVVAAKLGRANEAMESWQKALDVDPHQGNAHLYLAAAYEQQGQPAVAARHYQAYIALASAHPGAVAGPPGRVPSVAVALGDAYANAGQAASALAAYDSAIKLAEGAGDAKVESLALAHRADLLEKTGDAAAAARSYQRGIALDAKGSDRHAEAIDWFNYGQFLRRQAQGDRLALACFVHAEELLGNAPSKDLDTVRKLRQQTESRLEREAASIRQDLNAVLAEATALQLPAR